MDENQGQAKKGIPAEAVDLYTRYIHGEVSRRDFLKGVNRFAVAGLSAAAIVEALMPNYALGQQVRKDDEHGRQLGGHFGTGRLAERADEIAANVPIAIG